MAESPPPPPPPPEPERHPGRPGSFTTSFVVFALSLLCSGLQLNTHLRVEAHSADAAGSMLPLGGRWESEGVMEDGLLHGVHLEGEQIQKRTS